MNAFNLLIVVFTFACILGSPFSQRARVALTFAGTPALIIFAALKLSKPDYNLVEELTFYASFHSDPRNQLIHVIFVPLIVATAMVWMAYVPVRDLWNNLSHHGHFFSPLMPTRSHPLARSLFSPRAPSTSGSLCPLAPGLLTGSTPRR